MARRAKSGATKQPAVREPAVAYEVRSMAEVFWTAFRSLSQEQQGAFVERLLADPKLYEEISDAVTMIESENESYRPFEEFEEELRREKLL